MKEEKDPKIVKGILVDIVDFVSDIAGGGGSDGGGDSGEGEESGGEKMSIKDRVIDALHIPDAETIKEALHLPSKDDIIEHMFETSPIEKGVDYLVGPLRLDDCAERIASQVKGLEGKADEILSALKEKVPTADQVMSSFKDKLPTKDDIIVLLDKIPGKDAIMSKLNYPASVESITSILPDIPNRAEIMEKLNIPTKETVVQKLDDLINRTNLPSEMKQIIDDVKSMVPDVVNMDIIKSLIPDVSNFDIPADLKNIKQTLMDTMESKINIPVKDIVDMFKIPDAKELVDSIKNMADDAFCKVEDVMNMIPDIPCKNEINNMFQNVVKDSQEIFDSFNIPSIDEIHEKLNIDNICETLELPHPMDVLSSMNIPTQTDILDKVKSTIPVAKDFINSLNIPSPLDLSKNLFDKLSIGDDLVDGMSLKAQISSIMSSTMEQTQAVIQRGMGLLDKGSVLTNLVNDKFIPSTKEILENLHMPTYEEMAAKLNLPTSDKFLGGMKQFIGNHINLEAIADGADLSAVKTATDAMLSKLNPKNVIDSIGKDAFNRVSNMFNTAADTIDDAVEFFKTGFFPEDDEEEDEGEEGEGVGGGGGDEGGE